MLLTTLLLLLPLQAWAQCEEGWTLHGNHCYKKMSAPEVNASSANDVCQSEGANLTSATPRSQRLFLIEFTRNGEPTHVSNQTIIGMSRKSASRASQRKDGLPNVPTNRTQKVCRVLVVDPAHRNGMELSNGQIGYVTDIDCEAPAVKFVCRKATGIQQQLLKRAKRGTGVNEKCGLLGRQHNVSMVFIIDSSVNKENWEKLTKFVKNAAPKIPNSFRIGFVQFSGQLKQKQWLGVNWSVEDFEKKVPSGNAGGGKNNKRDTASGLTAAKELLANIPHDEKIVILITNGLPSNGKEKEQKKALEATDKAAKELKEQGTHLVVMGFGEKLKGKGKIVKKWLQEPEQDYLYFKKPAKELKDSELDELLGNACRETKQRKGNPQQRTIFMY